MSLAKDTGHRERQALMNYWNNKVNAGPLNRHGDLQDGRAYQPFWKALETVQYDPVQDSFTLPDGTVVTVAEANNVEYKEK